MSDYIPDPGRPTPGSAHFRDGYKRFPSTGNGLYVVVGTLVVAILVSGFLLFSGPPTKRLDQARLPDRTMTAPPIERTAPLLPVPTPTAPVQQ